jgi:hypothetical protein
MWAGLRKSILAEKPSPSDFAILAFIMNFLEIMRQNC